MRKALEQLHLNHMAKGTQGCWHVSPHTGSICKLKQKKKYKNSPTYFIFQAAWPKEKTMLHEIPVWPWESLIFREYGLPSKTVSDMGTNYVSEKLKEFCMSLCIHHAVSLSNNHESNGQAEACIKFVKRSMKVNY